MRKENNICLNETKKEDLELLKGEKVCIFIAKKYGVIGSCDVMMISTDEIFRIGSVDTEYLYGGNKNRKLERKVEKMLEDYYFTSKIPPIVISVELTRIFNV